MKAGQALARRWWSLWLLLPLVACAGPARIAEGPLGWTWVGADGQPFLSVGACVVGPWDSPGNHDPENPGYSPWKTHSSMDAWADTTLRRLKQWRFNTLGAWADHGALGPARKRAVLRGDPAVPWITPVLHMGGAAGAPWWDMWDTNVVARMESRAREEMAPYLGDPGVLGYYSDNELGWWSASLWKLTLEQRPTSGQRQRLVSLLRTRYADDWARFREDFDVEGAVGWAELEQGGAAYVRPGGNGLVVVRAFTALLAERYYGLVRRVLRQVDPQALFLGDRYASFYHPEVVRAAAPHVDAISSNLNADWNDGSFLRCYLSTLHEIAGKPVLVTEFYAAARENRSGNRNSHGIYPVVQTQAQRARVVRRTVEQVARHRGVIGLDWFQFADEPRHGRGDGENFNFGLVDIHDQPYDAVTAAFATFDPLRIRAADRPRPDARVAGIPPAPRSPFEDFVATRALVGWDRERGFVPPTTAEPCADLYAAWSRDTLFLGLCAMDAMEQALYRGPHVPKQDRASWTVEINGHEVIRVRVGAGREPVGSTTSVRVEQLQGPAPAVRTVVALGVPVAEFGLSRLRPGTSLRIRCRYHTHGNVQQVGWEGTYTLSR